LPIIKLAQDIGAKMHKKKILIVDDETDALSILEKELAARGYSIITAENGKDALISAKSKHPNLIILDVALPDMLGGEVAVKLKEDLGTKNIPVIFLSAMFTKTEESKRGHVVRSNIMFAKPYDIGELLAAIKKLLGEKRKYRLKKRRRVNGPKKILIVDDEKDVLRTMGLHLKSSGYDVVFAGDGASAISVALAKKPDLILLDICLPGGDAFYVMQQITSNPQMAITPIIIITARDPSEYKERTLEAGAQAFFQKPVDVDKLLTVIQKILEEPLVKFW